MCLLKHASNELYGFRGLLTSGGSHNYVTEECVRKLGLEYHVFNSFRIGKKVSVTIYSSDQLHTAKIECCVVPNIGITTPTEDVEFRAISLITGCISLADPDLHKARPLDLLVSCDSIRSFIGNVHELRRGLSQQDTVLGKIIFGKLSI